MKKTTFISPIDMICPHYCKGCGMVGSVLCERCKNDIILNHTNYCPNCKRMITEKKCQYCNLPISYMIGWRDELIGKLVHDLKYRSTRQLGGNIAEILDEILPVFGDEIHIVPLPTIRKHIRERGLDHTLLIAKKLARRRGWTVDQILGRGKNTVQVGADETLRRWQAKDAYRVIKKADKTKTYLLIDDVWTTGSSMRAAIRKLREAGAQKIVIVVLAVNRIKET